MSMARSKTVSYTHLRNIIGDLELDQSLTSRDHINGQMRAILDEATDNWGIKVNRVELKNIMPPREMCIRDRAESESAYRGAGSASAGDIPGWKL